MKPGEVKAMAKGFQFRGKRLSAKIEETHISWVLLTTHYAFKIKKAVKLSFLDFSTLSLRKEACERELVLNRRLTDIYLRVIPIKVNNGFWSFGGHSGVTVDYAVVMRRMQTHKRMDFLLEKKQVSKEQVSDLARFIADFHAGAKVVSTPFARLFTGDLFNDLSSVNEFVAQNVGPGVGRIIPTAIAWSNSFLKQHATRFRERVLLGYRRDLHGDLHSANIFLYRKPVIFDCIEFNDEFRYVDVLDEVAFLYMDLESLNQEHLAKTLFNSYSGIVHYVETPEDLKIFSYYKCYRANVRAKVHAIAARRELNPQKRDRHIERMVRHLSLIRKYIDS